MPIAHTAILGRGCVGPSQEIGKCLSVTLTWRGVPEGSSQARRRTSCSSSRANATTFGMFEVVEGDFVEFPQRQSALTAPGSKSIVASSCDLAL